VTASGEKRGRGGVGLVVRLARRQALESVGRSALIAVLIALPIVALSGVDTIQASRTASPAQSVRLELGEMQARITMFSAPDPGLKQDPITTFQIASSDLSSSTDEVRNPSALLPTGTRVVTMRSTSAVAKTAAGVGYFGAVEGEPWDPSFAGRMTIISGTRPTTPSEIMVSPAALVRLGVPLGGTVHVTKPKPATFTVVGTLKDAQNYANDDVLYGGPGAFDGVLPADDLTGTSFYLPDVPLEWSQVRALNKEGALVFSRAVVLDPPSKEVAPRDGTDGSGAAATVLVVALIGAFAMFEVCLLAGAAFAVGARQRQRALAILASVGASRRVLFAVMSVEGILLGLIGGILGTGLGVAAAAVLGPLIANGNETQFPAFQPDWPALALIVLASMASGWMAAALPARAASKVDIVAALRGARRPPKVSTRRPIVGVFIVAGGSVLALMGGVVIIASQQSDQVNDKIFTTGIVLLAAGPVAMQIGVILIAPLLLRWAMRLLSSLGPGARLSGRDASRNPSRTVPALAAVMSTVFVSAFVMCLLSSSQVATIRDYAWQSPKNFVSVSLTTYTYSGNGSGVARRQPPREVVDAIDRAFPGAQAKALSGSPDFDSLGSTVASYTVARPVKQDADGTSGYSGNGDHILVGSEEDLALLLGEPLTDTSVTTLRSGGIVSLVPNYLDDGKVTLDTVAAPKTEGDPPGAPLRSVSVPASQQRSPHQYDTGLFLLPETAAIYGVRAQPSVVVAQLQAPPTVAQQDAARANLLVVDGNLYPYVETGPSFFAEQWAWILFGVTSLLALGAATIAISLARADGRRDDEVLDAVGASPRVRRSFGFWQGIIIAGLGAVIGVGLGLVPAFALGFQGSGSGPAMLPFAPPWLQLCMMAFGTPLLIAGGAWLTVRRRRGEWRVRRTLG
jgi:cell division protein FtsX